MPNSDLLIIARVYLISFLLQLLCFPLTRKIFAYLPDHGYPLSRLISTLLAALMIWEVGNLGLPANTNLGLGVVTVMILAINIFILLKNRSGKAKVSKETLKMVVMEEYLFFVGFLGIAFVRSFAPNIDSLEKFMDFGFVNRYLLSPTLPAEDMWQAGKNINYYSFGHFWASIVIRYFGVSPAIGYNLMLAFIAGLSLSISFSIAHLLSGAKKMSAIIGGLIGAFATVLAGNTHVLWFIFKNRTLEGYWYAEATRFIQNTIHEFPSYSFVVADLHGHLLDLPVVLAFLLLFLHWLKTRRLLDEMIMGILFGVMMMTNTWDVAVYGLVLVVSGVFLMVHDRRNFLKLIRSAGVMLFFMILTALPWFISFQSISSGIKVVTERSPLWQLAVLWSGGLIVSLVAVLTAKKDEMSLPIRIMAICILLLIIIPELIYAKDIYPSHPRANTMFKLTYQASIMIGLLMGGAMGMLFDRERRLFRLWRSASILLMGAIFVGVMIFPAEAFPNFYANFDNYRGLDGEAWISTEMPERYGVIKYLRNNADGNNMVEAVGDSYTNYNAISVFSGVPTIQGWRVHEWLWRGGYDPVALRDADVKDIYEGSNMAKVRELLQKYRVGWIVVGKDERDKYIINEESLREIGNEVWRQGDTYLIKVEP